ncbi:MAG: phosphotransferase enzyme family protein, partial [Desulforhopalus sp.]
SDHLRQKRSFATVRFSVASPVRTTGGDSCVIDRNGEFWRAQSYIPHVSREVLAGPEQARQVGAVLGWFHRLLIDLDGTELADPLPGFHDLPLYLENFDKIRQAGTGVSGGSVQRCMENVERYRARAATLQNGMRAGILRKQPVHGDPKVDNFLFDNHHEPHGLLDLDTVAMGLVHHDLGDCLRSCCNRAGEAGEDGGDVVFDLHICEAVLRGYFSVNGTLGERQRNYIFDAILLLCFELGVRFLTDYLAGNRYFKIEGEDDNLLRAARQFKLTEDVARKEQQIRHLVESAIPRM